MRLTAPERRGGREWEAEATASPAGGREWEASASAAGTGSEGESKSSAEEGRRLSSSRHEQRERRSRSGGRGAAIGFWRPLYCRNSIEQVADVVCWIPGSVFIEEDGAVASHCRRKFTMWIKIINY